MRCSSPSSDASSHPRHFEKREMQRRDAELFGDVDRARQQRALARRRVVAVGCVSRRGPVTGVNGTLACSFG